MRPWLVRLLVIALVPVLFVASNAPAAEAATYGSSVQTSWDFDNWRPGWFGNCAAAAYWKMDGSQESVVVNGDCSVGWNVSRVEVSQRYSGADSDGDLCSAESDYVSVGSSGWSYTLGVETDGTESECHIDTMCWQLRGYPKGPDQFGTLDWEGCAAADLGAPKVSTPSCTGMVVPGQPTVGSPYWSTGVPATVNPSADGAQWPGGAISPGKGWYVDITLSVSPAAGGTSQPQLYVISSKNSETGQGPQGGEAGNMFGRLVSPADGVPHSATWLQLKPISGPKTVTWTVPVSTSWSGASSSVPPAWTIDGVGVFESKTGSPTWARDVPQNNASGIFGLTDLTRCATYWGPKIAQVLFSQTDEPMGPLVAGPPTETGNTEPPTNTPVTQPGNDDCEFSFTDPSTWAGAGICALVKLISAVLDVLANILQTLGGIAAAIAQAILDGLGTLLQALFVPDGDHLEQKIDQVKAAWDDTPPGEVVSTVSTLPGKFSAPSASGCAGPSMPITFPSIGGERTSYTFSPLSTCSAGLDRIATIFRLALQVGVWLSAIMLSVRLLLASLGYNTTWGKGGDDE